VIGDGPTPGIAFGPRRRWPAGFLGMLALMLAVEAVVERAGREIGTMINADWRRQGRVASTEAVTRADILCVGDSLVKTGIVPAALEARLDLTVYNLAAMNAPAPANYWLLKRAFDAGARPRAIVLDAHEAQLGGTGYRNEVVAWAGLLSPPEAWWLGRDDHDPGFFGSYVVHWAVPSARFRLDLRKVVVERLVGIPADRETPWPAVLDRQAWRNRGACLLPSEYAKQRTDPYPYGILPPGEWEACYRLAPLAHPTNLLYLHRLLAMVEARGIPVFFVVPPIHPAVLEVRERVGLEAEYLGFVGRVRERYANVVVVDARHVGFDHTKFFDSCHLHAESATALSNALAEVVGRHIDGARRDERWVALSDLAEPTARLAVESMEESKAVEEWRRLIR
jgi:hypothetical protein